MKENDKKLHNNFNLAEPLKYSSAWFEDPTNNRELKGFIVMMATVFNDLKDLQILASEATDYSKDASRWSPVWGQANGIQRFCCKMSVSIIHEFLEFLKVNKTHLENIKVKKAIEQFKKDFPKGGREWDDLVKASKEQKVKNSILSKIAQMRNNSSFHYYGTSMILKGMMDHISAVKKNQKEPQSRFLYVSYGKTNEETRFYFADAAINHQYESLFEGANDKEVHKYIRTIQKSIRFILENFIKENWEEQKN